MNVEAFPKSANVYDSLGEALEIAGRPDEARKAYEQALKVDPNFTHAADALKKLR
jgi:Flp pilus assembly protein TadD